MDGTDVQINLINNLEFVDNGSLDGTDVQVNLINNLPVSVANPYHFDTDPDLDPGCEKFVTDPDPGRTLIRIRIQVKTIQIRIQQKRTKYQENL